MNDHPTLDLELGEPRRRCRTCNRWLTLDNFHRSRTYPRTYCRDCSNERSRQYGIENRERRNLRLQRWRRSNPEAARAHDRRQRLRRNYGLTPDQADALLKSNGGRCWICDDQPSRCIDHDHATGRVRGALCNSCNTFSGVGWDFAAETLGLEVHGIDNEPTVGDTRTKLGWTTTVADILTLDPADWAGVDGLIASPPCQSWSRAGKGAGLDDPRGQLVWRPLVWALAIQPRWVACEQVPEARGAFELIAHRLREVGYHAAGVSASAAVVTRERRGMS